MDYEQIKEDLLKVFEQEPSNVEFTGKLASAFMETRDFKGALQILKRAVKTRENEQTLTNLGYFLLYEGEPVDNNAWRYQPEKAIEVLENAIKLGPLTHMPFSVLGEAYLLKERNAEAENVLTESIRKKQTIANLNNLGVSLFRQCQYEQANNWFTRAYKREKEDENPTYIPYLNYGLNLAKLGLKEAFDVANDLLIKQQKDDYSQINITDVANLYYEIGDYQKTVEVTQEALASFSVYPRLFEIYVSSLCAIGQWRNAELFYNQTLDDAHEQIKDIIEDDDLDEDNGNARIRALEEDIILYKAIYDNAKSGIKMEVPSYLPRVIRDCYLFGCLRHHNEE